MYVRAGGGQGGELKRGVWQMAGGNEGFMYYASNKEWMINNREAMEAREAAGGG
jgi:hypothetical protein